MYHILLVEDDKQIVDHLTEFLKGEGFLITSVTGQGAAIESIRNNPYDLLLLDISLPDGNGFIVCKAAKEERDIPVIFLTASGDEYSVVTGLDMGADDYIAKPFRPRELVSRIRSVLRRRGNGSQLLEAGDVKIDTVKGVVLKREREVFLTALEYRLLLVFMNNKGIILSRNKLLEEIWDIAGDFVNDNTLTVYIKRLREKIEDDPQNPGIIKTVRGLGYRVEEGLMR
ncbi:DNA-binding response OmpR family regulator [Anaerotaenia torta]|uniref:response regulator transcription factor n=1 Tax=Anaerotaenia torta TaxID=433293 RepID=UPI003D19E3CB